MYRIIKRYFRRKGTKKRLKKVISQDRSEIKGKKMKKSADTEQHQGIIKNNTELDSTLLVIFGSILAFVVVTGIFAIHILNPEDTLLSPEILMALIMLPSTLISFAMGKKSGMREAMTNGNTTTTTEKPKQEGNNRP